MCAFSSYVASKPKLYQNKDILLETAQRDGKRSLTRAHASLHRRFQGTETDNLTDAPISDHT